MRLKFVFFGLSAWNLRVIFFFGGGGRDFVPCLEKSCWMHFNASFVLRFALYLLLTYDSNRDLQNWAFGRWSNFSKLRRALGDGNDCNKGLWERTVGTEQHKSLGQNPESCFFKFKYPKRFDGTTIEGNQYSPPFFISFRNHRGVIKLPTQTMYY